MVCAGNVLNFSSLFFVFFFWHGRERHGNYSMKYDREPAGWSDNSLMISLSADRDSYFSFFLFILFLHSPCTVLLGRIRELRQAAGLVGWKACCLELVSRERTDERTDGGRNIRSPFFHTPYPYPYHRSHEI